jgi:hypothetical protein
LTVFFVIIPTGFTAAVAVAVQRPAFNAMARRRLVAGTAAVTALPDRTPATSAVKTNEQAICSGLLNIGRLTLLKAES